MSLKSRLASFLLGESYQRLEAEAAAYREAYERLPALLHPGSGLFSEMDDQYLQLLFQFTSQYDVLYGQSPATGIFKPTEQQRLQIVYRSRRASLYDPVTQSILRTWLNFAFGVNIDVIPKDETETPQTIFTAKECWDDYFTSQRNRRIFGARYIDRLNNRLLTDGEFFLLTFTATDTGLSWTRLIYTEEIPDIIYDSQDRDKPLYYHRQYTDAGGVLNDVYYPDWLATDKELKRANVPDKSKVFRANGTTAKIVHLNFFDIGTGRGWPLMTAGLDWTLAYKDNLQDQATVAKLVAMIVNKLTVKGGSRAVQSLKGQFQSTLVNSDTFLDRNPPAVAGSTFIGNENLDLQRMPLSTGARDNSVTSASLLSMGLNAGGNLPLDWFGRGDVNTYAQANSANIPAFRNFNRYQIFWSSAWSDLCELVLREYQAANPEANYQTYESDVSLDSLLQPELKDITQALSQVYRDVLIPLMQQGELPQPVAIQLIIKTLQVLLQAFGIKDSGDLINDEDFEMADGTITKTIEALKEGRVQVENVVDFLVGEIAANGK